MSGQIPIPDYELGQLQDALEKILLMTGNVPDMMITLHHWIIREWDRREAAEQQKAAYRLRRSDVTVSTSQQERRR